MLIESLLYSECGLLIRWPTLEDCRRAIKEEQQRLCNYVETIRFNLHQSLADQLQPMEPLHISNGQ